MTASDDPSSPGRAPGASPAGDGSAAPQRYQREEEIARGGMGAIYRVHDLQLDRTLAMKLALRGKGSRDNTNSASELELARFVEEARVTAQLDHPGVVPVHEFGTDPESGRPFFTMKLVKGRELGDVFDLAREGREGWNLSRAVGVLVTVCRTVAYAHSKSVIHRDLKPANVMVGRFGEVHVMDWGLAKVLDRTDLHERRLLQAQDQSLNPIRSTRSGEGSSTSQSPLQTLQGSVVGTPAYMAPEQAKGQLEQVDALSDVYALGAILYRLLAGHSPYQEPGSHLHAGDVLSLVFAGPPTAVLARNPSAPPELAAVCEKAMARQREQRYTSALELAEDLQAWLDGRVVRAHGGGALAELKAWVLRNRMVAASLAAVLLVVVAALGTVLGVQSAAARRVAVERDRAQAAVVDLHAQAGTRLAQQNERTDAALFFAQAAALSNEPAVREQNLARSRSWLSGLPELEQVIDTGGGIAGARVHPDGVHALLIGSSPGFCRLLDTREGRLVACPALEDERTCVATWNADGTRIALGRTDGTVQVLRFPELDEIATWTMAGEVSALQFTPQGDALATCAQTLQLRRVSDWQLAAEEVPFERAIEALRISEDGQCLVVASPGGKSADWGVLRVFRRGSDGRLLEFLDPPLAFARYPSGARESLLPLMLPGQNSLVWASSWRELGVLELGTGGTRTIPVSADLGGISGVLPLRSRDEIAVLGFGGLTCLNLSTGAPIGRLLPLPNETSAAALHPTQPLLYAGCADGRLRLVPVPDCGEVLGGILHSSQLDVVELLPGGTHLLTAQSGGTNVRVWRVGGERIGPSTIRIAADLDDNPINVSADGRCVMAAGWNSVRPALETTRVLDPRTGEPLGPPLSTGRTLNAGALSRDGEMAALLCAPTGGIQDGWIRFKNRDWRPGSVQVLWSRTGMPITKRIDTPTEPIGGAFRPDGHELAVALADGALLAISLPAGEVRAVRPPSEGLGFSHTQRDRVRYGPDGSFAVSFGFGFGAELWDTRSWTLRAKLAPEGNVIDVNISPDGRCIATATGVGGLARVWDSTTGEPLGPSLVHSDRVFRARFSPDGKHLLTACRDRLARLWDWRTGELALPTLDHEGEVFDVGFAPDGNSLYTCGGYEGASDVRVWSALDGLPLVPPVRLSGICLYMPVLADGRAVCGTSTGFEILDLPAWIVALGTGRSIDEQLRVCKLMSGRRVLPGGSSINLSVAEWLALWRSR